MANFRAAVNLLLESDKLHVKCFLTNPISTLNCHADRLAQNVSFSYGKYAYVFVEILQSYIASKRNIRLYIEIISRKLKNHQQIMIK